MICPHCGAKIKKTTQICPNCQQKVEVPSQVKSRWIYLTWIALIILLIGAGAVSYWYFRVKPFAYPVLTAQARKLIIPKRVALSKDQARVVSFFGYPNDFQVTFDAVTGDRTEIWLYFEGDQAYVFENGRFMTDDQLLPEVRSSTHITHLRPEEINGLMAEKQLTEILGEPVYITKDKISAVDNVVVVGYEDAVAIFRDSRLVFFQSRPGLPPLEEKM